MAAHPTAPKPPSSAGERLLPLWIVCSMLLVVGLFAALAFGRSWLPWSDLAGEQAAPHWLTPATVRATFGNGEVVKARVAIDAPDPDTRAWLNDHPGQLALLMQVSVAEYQGRDASGAERVQGLADEIEDRVNEFLATGKVPPVRDVVIQDLVVSKP